ncbi:uncharacterized mitochondrial protein-like protein [Tanacetum coccineum]
MRNVTPVVLQHEHYALWEVIEFGNSYKVPLEETAKDKSLTGEGSGSTKKKGRTVAITAEDIQKRRNDVKARTALLLALPDEHQLRFSKYETTKELWEAILKTFGRNEATKKTKKNQLKQQYDDLNQKFLSSLAPEWLVYPIVWRNRDDLDTMSLDDVYNHLKVFELEVQKNAGANSQNMDFISSSNTNSGKGKVPTVQGVSTTSVQPATTQPNGSQIKYEDITQIDDDDIEEMDIKWNLALLSMRADRFWKKTGKKITIQGSDVAGFDKSKVECFNCHKMGHFARECRSPRSQDRGKKEIYKKDPRVEEPAPKAMIAIDGIGWDWSYMAEEDENHALVADEEEVPTEYALMAKSSSSSDNEVYDDSFCSKSCRKNTGLSQVEARLVEFKKNEIKFCERIRVLERDLELRDNKIENLRNELDEIKKEKESIDFKIENFENASKNLDSLLGNQRLDKDKKGLGFNEYSAVPPPPAQVYSPPKKDLSWMGLPEFVDDTVTDYSRPTPSVDVSKDVSASSLEQGGSFDNVVSKPMIRFVKETGCPSVSKDNNTENPRKPTVKYAEMYRNTSQSPKVRSNNFGPPIIEDWDSDDESEIESTPNKTDRPSIEQVKMNQTKFPTVGLKVPTAKPTIAADNGNRGKVVKASACWIWKPKQNQPDQGSNLNGVSGIPQDNTDDNVADLLTKAFDVGRFQYLVKIEHNADFHQIVDFLEASHIRYALMVSPTVYVSYIRQFWSTARLKTVDGETNIITKVNGKKRTVSESSIRRHLKLNDEEVFTTLRVNSPSFSGRTVQLFESMLVPQGEGLENPTEPHHTPSDQYESPPQEDQTTPQKPLQQETTIPSHSHSDISTPRRLTRGTTQISQSKVPSPGVDETASPTRDDRHGEAFPTTTSLDTGQDRENIVKTSAMPHESSLRVTSLDGGEGSMQQKLQELMDMCTNLQQQHLLMEQRIQRIDQGEDLLDGDTVKDSNKSAVKGSDSTDDTGNVLNTLGAANILASRGLRLVFTTASTVVSSVVATASGSFPTTAIFTAASVATPRVSRSPKGIVIESSPPISVNIPSISKEDKGKGIMTEPEQPSKEKVLEQMSAQLARELEAKFAQEDQIIREQAERDSEIARIHAEREPEMMIAELDRSNEMVAKYLSEYEKAIAKLSHDEKVELINELLEYQRNLTQIKKYQAQQSKLATKAERRKFYMSILRSNDEWMKSKRVKRPGIQLVQESSKKLKTAKASGSEPSQEQQTKEPKELSEEDLKKMMEIVPIEEYYIEALYAKYPIIDWEIYSEEQ